MQFAGRHIKFTMSSRRFSLRLISAVCT